MIYGTIYHLFICLEFSTLLADFRHGLALLKCRDCAWLLKNEWRDVEWVSGVEWQCLHHFPGVQAGPAGWVPWMSSPCVPGSVPGTAGLALGAQLELLVRG